jgi:hypothetical protein
LIHKFFMQMNKVSLRPVKQIAWTLLLGSALCGCTKNKKLQSAPEVPGTNPPLFLMSGSMPGFESNTNTWKEIVQGQDNTDTKIRTIKLYFSAGLMELCNDPSIAAWIYDRTQANEDKVVSFADLFRAFPEAKKIMESVPDHTGTIRNRDFGQLEAQLDYEGFQYNACVFLTNDGVAKRDYQPIVTPGVDIFDDTLRNRSDVSFAWYKDKNKELQKINVWEDLVNSTSMPVYAIGLLTKNQRPIFNGEFPEAKPTGGEPESDFTDQRIYIDKFVVGKRYDNSASSEYSMTGQKMMTNWTASNYNVYNGGQGFLRDWCYGSAKPSTDRIQVASVHKDLVNGWITVSSDKYFCKVIGDPSAAQGGGINPESDGSFNSFQGSTTPTYSRYLYFNTFEYDWFANKKFLGSGGQWTNPYVTLKGKMGYQQEWYQFDPYINSGGEQFFFKYFQIYPQPTAAFGAEKQSHSNGIGKGWMHFKRSKPCNW